MERAQEGLIRWNLPSCCGSLSCSKAAFLFTICRCVSQNPTAPKQKRRIKYFSEASCVAPRLLVSCANSAVAAPLRPTRPANRTGRINPPTLGQHLHQGSSRGRDSPHNRCLFCLKQHQIHPILNLNTFLSTTRRITTTKGPTSVDPRLRCVCVVFFSVRQWMKNIFAF